MYKMEKNVDGFYKAGIFLINKELLNKHSGWLCIS